jgi:glutaryl-CoA dehydrogenase
MSRCNGFSAIVSYAIPLGKEINHMSKPVFNWEDPFLLDQQLSDDERMVRDTARQFARDVLLPRVIDDFREERFEPDVLRQMGALGLLGPTIPEEYGGAGVNTDR